MKKKSLLSSLLSLSGIIIIFILGWIYFNYPTATIVIKPVTRSIEDQIEVKGSPSQNSIDWEKNILPLHKFEVEITYEDEIETTGKKTIGETRARGRVKIINENKEEKTIPEGTIVETESGIEFKTTKKIVVPGLEIDYLMDVPVGMKAGQKDVLVEAVKKGKIGNLGTGEITEFEKKRKKLYVVNPEPTVGGTVREYRVVNKKDLNRLEQKIKEDIKPKLMNRVYEKLGGNYRLFKENINYKELELSFDHQPGEIADVIHGTMVLMAEGYIVRNNELDRLVTDIVQKKLEQNNQLLSSGINIYELKLAEKEDDLYNIILELEVPVTPRIKTAAIVEKLSGSNMETARKILARQNDIAEYEIKTENSSDILPRLNFAIKVIVAQPEGYPVFNSKEEKG